MKLNISWLYIANNDIDSNEYIKVLAITIDDHLRFDQYIAILCSKGAMQLNAFRLTPKV